MTMNDEKHFAVCVRNEGYEESLELRKIYEVLEDRDAAKDGLLRASTKTKTTYTLRLGSSPSRFRTKFRFALATGRDYLTAFIFE